MSSISKNYLREVKNKSGDLAYYHRDYKNDLKAVDSNNYYVHQAKRIRLLKEEIQEMVWPSLRSSDLDPIYG